MNQAMRLARGERGRPRVRLPARQPEPAGTQSPEPMVEPDPKLMQPAAVSKRLSRAERDVLRERISTAVRVRELADDEAWKGQRANGRTAARQRL